MNLPGICTPTHPLAYRLYRAAAGKFCVMDIFSAVGNTPLLALHHICPGKERNRRIKIFGNKLYPKNPTYYIADRGSMNADETFCQMGDEILTLVNGVLEDNKAHVYQPLELE